MFTQTTIEKVLYKSIRQAALFGYELHSTHISKYGIDTTVYAYTATIISTTMGDTIDIGPIYNINRTLNNMRKKEIKASNK